MTYPFADRASRALVIAALLLVGGAGCRGPSEASAPGPPPDGAADALRSAGVPVARADIHGTITLVLAGLDQRPAVQPGAPDAPVSCPPDCDGGVRLRSVLIEEYPGETNRGDKSHVTVLKDARLLRRTASGVAPIGFADLRAGQTVEAWFTGPVAESYPTQATASVLVVDER
jgi:hypothetical protein